MANGVVGKGGEIQKLDSSIFATAEATFLGGFCVRKVLLALFPPTDLPRIGRERERGQNCKFLAGYPPRKSEAALLPFPVGRFAVCDVFLPF